MMDTTIQMMISTLTAALVTLILALYKNKGLLQDIYMKMNILLRRAELNPLSFDPSLADGKPKNGKSFLYLINPVNMKVRAAVIRWLIKHHIHKYSLIENQEHSFTMYIFDLKDSGSIRNIQKDLMWRISKDVHIPIWRDKNGYWVYMTTNGENIANDLMIKSDSYEALQNCFASIGEMVNEIQEEQNATKSIISLMEFDNKGFLTIVGDISKNKTFDNLFFEQKETIIPILKLFKENKLYPSHIPVDNKLGILLYGPPGTGKTAFITALANYLNRNLILVDMAKIRTQTQWNNIFRNATNKNNIFVFEEFDCMPCIQKRETISLEKPLDDKPITPEMMMMMAMNNKDNKAAEDYKKELDEKKDLIDLGFLLRKLDGIESVDGRFIIATTNHPERIDPALLRPGRFGIQIHLKKVNHQSLRQMLEMIYKTPISEDDVYEIEEYLWTPAEILQNSLLYSSPQEYLQFLRNGKPMDNF